MPSPSEVDTLKDILLRLAHSASGSVVSVLTHAGSGPESARVVEDVYPRLIEPYVDAAGTVSEQWYADLDPGSTFVVQPTPAASTALRESMQASVRWAFTQPDPHAALLGSTERRVFDRSRDTIAGNAHRERVKYARGASSTACAWCRMLATRGAVYKSEKSAVKGHDRCHCVPVPDRPGSPYVPPDYVAAWDKEYVKASKAVGENPDDIVNWMRTHEGPSSVAHKADIASPDIVLDGVHYTPAMMRGKALELYDDAWSGQPQPAHYPKRRTRPKYEFTKAQRAKLDARRWGADWYPGETAKLNKWREGTEYSLDQAAGIMAVTSGGNQSYSKNIAETMNFLKGRAVTADSLGLAGHPDIWGKVQAISRTSDTKEIRRIIAGVTGSKKESAYWDQLRGIDKTAVVDRWEARLLLGSDDKTAVRALTQVGGYDKLARAVQEAADARGVSVGTMQATGWVMVRGRPF